MAQCEPCIQIKKKDKKKKESQKGKGGERGEEKKKERGNWVFRFSLRSMEIEHRFSSKREEKLIHASRATHVYQNLGVSSNFTG